MLPQQAVCVRARACVRVCARACACVCVRVRVRVHVRVCVSLVVRAYCWWVEQDRPLVLEAEVSSRTTERVAVRASVASAVRVAPDHLADADLAPAPNLGEPFLVQYVLDNTVLRFGAALRSYSAQRS
jgi:hypothetical protein